MSTLSVNNIQFNQEGNAAISIANSYNVVVSVDGTEKIKVDSSGINVRGQIRVDDVNVIDSLTAVAGTFTASAAGNLLNGSKVIINSNGTVSAVSGPDQSLGEKVFIDNINAAGVSPVAGVYHTAEQKIVIAYRQQTTADGYAVVGQISGNTVTFGTPVIFDTTASSIAMTYDPDENRIVITYTSAAGANAVVGMVTGNSIVFGSGTRFTTNSTSFHSSSYDSYKKVVVNFFTDASESSRGRLIAGKINATANSITFGSTLQFTTASNTATYASIVYSPKIQRHFIAYADNSLYGFIRLANVTSNITPTVALTGGGSADFTANNTDRPTYITTTYDSIQDKFVIAYRDTITDNANVIIANVTALTTTSFDIKLGNTYTIEDSSITIGSVSSVYDENAKRHIIAYSANSTLRILPLSLTTANSLITFHEKQTLDTELNNSPFFLTSVYDSNQNKIAIAYTNTTTNFGFARVFENYSTNLTEENYVGVSYGAYSSGQNATIQVVGKVNDAQSNLAIGKKHYVQGNGTLSIVPSIPEVFAGTAISANKLIIKG